MWGKIIFKIKKIIKNYLRTTIVQQSLNDLFTVTIEHKRFGNLSTSQLIADFADMKVRKVHLE